MANETYESVLAEVQQRSDLFEYMSISQILEMDDDRSHEFSKEIFADFCDEFERRLKDLNRAREEEDMYTISNVSHYLEGYGANNGARNIQDIMRKVQYLGNLQDENGNTEYYTEKRDALKRISEILQGGDNDISDTLNYYRRLVKVA